MAGWILAAELQVQRVQRQTQQDMQSCRPRGWRPPRDPRGGDAVSGLVYGVTVSVMTRLGVSALRD